MTKPVRIQRKRVKGWKMPPNTMSVTRPGKWGNPYYPGCGIGYGYIDAEGHPHAYDNRDKATCVQLFRFRMQDMKAHEPARYTELIEPILGKNLACWCPIDQPCHADVLLELANA